MPTGGVTVFAVTPLWWLFRVRLSGRGRLCPGAEVSGARPPSSRSTANTLSSRKSRTTSQRVATHAPIPGPQPEQTPSVYPLRHNMDDSASGHDRRPKDAAAGVPDRWGGPMMDRGEVWWALLDEKRPVVLLSRDGAEELRAIQVVAPAGTDITDVAIEVRLGNGEGLPKEGVVRVSPPRNGFIP